MKEILERMYKKARQLLLEEFKHCRTEFQYKDAFGFDPNGDSCEIEIKLNDYDFFKEFTKPSKKDKHEAYLNRPDLCPTRFYFMVPRIIWDRALARINDTPIMNRYGLIVYDPFMDSVKIVKKSEKLSDFPFRGQMLDKPFSDQRLKMVKNLPESIWL